MQHYYVAVHNPVPYIAHRRTASQPPTPAGPGRCPRLPPARRAAAVRRRRRQARCPAASAARTVHDRDRLLGRFGRSDGVRRHYRRGHRLGRSATVDALRTIDCLGRRPATLRLGPGRVAVVPDTVDEQPGPAALPPVLAVEPHLRLHDLRRYVVLDELAERLAMRVELAGGVQGRLHELGRDVSDFRRHVSDARGRLERRHLERLQLRRERAEPAAATLRTRRNHGRRRLRNRQSRGRRLRGPALRWASARSWRSAAPRRLRR